MMATLGLLGLFMTHRVPKSLVYERIAERKHAGNSRAHTLCFNVHTQYKTEDSKRAVDCCA